MLETLRQRIAAGLQRVGTVASLPRHECPVLMMASGPL